jgi:PAS domain S-box-containing protein
MTDKQRKEQSIHELNLIKRDFKTLRQTEDELIISDIYKRFDKIFAKSNAVKLLVNPESGKIVDANAKACEFYGCTYHELLTKKITEINKLKESEVIEEYKKQQEEKRDYFVNRQLTRDGVIVPVEVRSALITKNNQDLFFFLIHEYHDNQDYEIEVKLETKDEETTENNSDSGKLMFAEDLDIIERYASDLISTTKKLAASEQKLKELNLSKDRFFSIISHDLKNSFTAILGLSRLLSSDNYYSNSENVKETAGLIYTSSQKLYSLLENLLEWAKLQRDEIKFGRAHFNIYEAAEDIVGLFTLKLNQKNIKLINEIDKETVIDADQNMIKTVIRNLISNAINFTNQSGTIRLSSERINGNVEITVNDNGIGIEKENIGKLFRIDEKYININTDGEKGTGLGLILCKEFVEKNGGKIWVESEPGKGSSFKFTLPAGKN